jgi:gluconolactonase
MVGSAFTAHASDFLDVLGPEPRLTCVAQVDAHEGPVYLPDEGALYFTTTPEHDNPPAVRVKRLRLGADGLSVHAAEAIATDTRVANGMTAAPGGGLFVCEQGSHETRARIAHLDMATGELSTVTDGWRGLPFNSPNDVIVHSDGSIWFTDPSYGHLQGFRPPPSVGDYVYRYDPTSGDTRVVLDSFDKPNGLAFSPDETTLYVTDSGANQEPGSYDATRPHRVMAHDVTGGQVTYGRLFAVVSPGFPDGLKVDSAGRVYASSFSGVQVFDPRGDLIGEINLPGAVNFTFGGPGNHLLYITTDDAVWAAVLAARAPSRSDTSLSLSKGA